MKKLFSLIFAAMIVLSGMHLTLASHLCGGELAAVKVSFTQEKADCGMQMGSKTASTTNSFLPESCCKDVLSFYAVDSNYNPSSIQMNKPVHQLLQVLSIPVISSQHFFNTSLSRHTNVQPPGHYLATAVSLPDICVFLI